VTDGTSFWVVDGTALKVFKYTLSGSLLGSWKIDPANTHPTGITINPNNVSDIWIVDNGTDKVYQYVGAASRTSGSQNAAATFALAPGDTNPQALADPPPGTRIIPAPLADHAAADGWMAETLSSEMRPARENVASSAGVRPSLASWLLGELARTTPIVPPSRNAGQPGVHATVTPVAPEPRSANRSATGTPDPRLIKAVTSNLRHWAVDQVFADPALESIDNELLSRVVVNV